MPIYYVHIMCLLKDLSRVFNTKFMQNHKWSIIWPYHNLRIIMKCCYSNKKSDKTTKTGLFRALRITRGVFFRGPYPKEHVSECEAHDLALSCEESIRAGIAVTAARCSPQIHILILTQFFERPQYHDQAKVKRNPAHWVNPLATWWTGVIAHKTESL